MGDTDTKKKRDDSKKRGGDRDSEDEEKKLALKVKSYTDIQRFKLEKLMKDPSRPAFIPERRDEKNVNVAPEFNHNIMGSSAGAGSGEFHLYRQMRRKEQNRMKILGEREDRDELNEAYHAKLQENQKMADEKTNKKRKKRMKKKQNQLKKKKENKAEGDKSESSEEESDVEDDSPKPTDTSEAKDNTEANKTSDKVTSNLDNTDKSADIKPIKEKKGLSLVFYQ